ncbi:MAG: hypothetical protein IH836_09160 [Proteobacteria bacterium]|nr:hypothetical protein [Pseudomonadota bacterium]
MQKLPVVFLFVYFFFLSACNFTSPRDDIGIPRQISTAEESEAQDLNVAKSSEKSDPNSVIS